MESRLKRVSFFCLSLLLLITLSCANNNKDTTTDDDEVNANSDTIDADEITDEDISFCNDGKKWHEPITITDPQYGKLLFSSLTKLEDGGAILIYLQGEGLNAEEDDISYLWYNIYKKDLGWDKSQIIEQWDSDTIPFPEKDILVTSLKGNSLFLLIKTFSSETSKQELLLYEYSSKSGWLPPHALDSTTSSTGQSYYYLGLNIQNNNDGDAIVVWSFWDTKTDDVGTEDRRTGLFANTYTKKSGWSDKHTIVETGDYDFIYHATVLDSEGDATIAVRTKKDDIYNQQYIIEHTKNIGWQELEIMSFDNHIWRMELYDENNIFAPLQPLDDEDGKICSAHYVKGEEWIVNETLLRENINKVDSDYFYNFYFSINSIGNVVATWSETYFTSYSQESRLWINTYTPESGWKGEEILASKTASSSIQSDISKDGNIFISWEESKRVGGYFDREHYLWTKRYKPNDGWCPPEIVSEWVVNNYLWPQLLVDSSGDAVMIWETIKDDNDNEVIRTTEFY